MWTGAGTRRLSGSTPEQAVRVPVFVATCNRRRVTARLGSAPERPVKRRSSEFHSYQWNGVGRMNTAQHVKSNTRKQPKPQEPMELDPQLSLICPAGGIVLFSAAQMHPRVPKTSGRARYSIDFRTVNRADVEFGHRAPNIDAACVGTSLRDFVRATDGTRMPEEVIPAYDDESARVGELVFQWGS